MNILVSTTGFWPIIPFTIWHDVCVESYNSDSQGLIWTDFSYLLLRDLVLVTTRFWRIFPITIRHRTFVGKITTWDSQGVSWTDFSYLLLRDLLLLLELLLVLLEELDLDPRLGDLDPEYDLGLVFRLLCCEEMDRAGDCFGRSNFSSEYCSF